MQRLKKKRNNRIVKLHDENRISFNYIARIEGLSVKTVFEIYKRETARKAVDNSAK